MAEISVDGDKILWHLDIDGMRLSRGMIVTGRFETEDEALSVVRLLRKSAEEALPEISNIRKRAQEKQERIAWHKAHPSHGY